jgi:protein TonB
VTSAFEWRSSFDTEIIRRSKVTDVFQETIQITEQIPPKPPKPKVKAPVLIIVNDEEIIDSPDITFDPEDLAEDDLGPIDDIKDEEPEIIWEGIIESMPKPINGYKAFYTFIGKNLKYPKQAQRMGIEGKVFIQFVINKKGEITDVKVLKGIGAGCDAEAERVMNLAPKWNPGKQRGKPVHVRMVLPLTFRLK